MKKPLQTGYTLLEIVVVVGIVLILAALAGPKYIEYKRTQQQWEHGAYTTAPQIVPLPPGTANYVFKLTQGKGVDQYNQPIIKTGAQPIGGRSVTFTLTPGNPNHQGVITTLNSQTIDATSGTTTTDTLGLVTIQISLDDFGSWKLTADVAPDANGQFGGSESFILVSR
ncbi:prepilin-type N-terminal cleavage/methylation domain-containing protein [Aestuariicella sp. G3-2]|uniref:prepilin-type N-terminal cleavage/methylation domain-containing protein n=1 Tax=Pseudomaricurvus albidus TaxID=2842452 RepID=UPI001C0E2D6B|nr:prepilin-type N-terminal cleavage/methylation domain-containing protein [Aestuariicella albida]MBU3068821.1 prepilin-type N-terminal cleavage/methylation domain-containing protein [Aestuariicella albida]